jgi:hypothetical protein
MAGIPISVVSSTKTSSGFVKHPARRRFTSIKLDGLAAAVNRRILLSCPSGGTTSMGIRLPATCKGRSGTRCAPSDSQDLDTARRTACREHRRITQLANFVGSTRKLKTMVFLSLFPVPASLRGSCDHATRKCYDLNSQIKCMDFYRAFSPLPAS